MYFIINYNETDINKELFDALNNQNQISFNTLFRTDTSEIKYNINWKLRNPKNKSVIIICSANNNIDLENNMLIKAFLDDSFYENADIRINILFDGSFSFKTFKS